MRSCYTLIVLSSFLYIGLGVNFYKGVANATELLPLKTSRQIWQTEQTCDTCPHRGSGRIEN